MDNKLENDYIDTSITDKYTTYKFGTDYIVKTTKCLLHLGLSPVRNYIHIIKNKKLTDYPCLVVIPGAVISIVVISIVTSTVVRAPVVVVILVIVTVVNVLEIRTAPVLVTEKQCSVSISQGRSGWDR